MDLKGKPCFSMLGASLKGSKPELLKVGSEAEASYSHGGVFGSRCVDIGCKVVKASGHRDFVSSFSVLVSVCVCLESLFSVYVIISTTVFAMIYFVVTYLVVCMCHILLCIYHLLDLKLGSQEM